MTWITLHREHDGAPVLYNSDTGAIVEAVNAGGTRLRRPQDVSVRETLDEIRALLSASDCDTALLAELWVATGAQELLDDLREDDHLTDNDAARVIVLERAARALPGLAP